MGAPRRVAAAAWGWLHRYRLSIWVVVFTVLVVFALVDGRRTDERLDRDAARDEASDCLRSWQRTEGSRAAIKASVEGVLTLAFSVATNLTPERRAQIEAAAAPIIADAQAEIIEPSCDRERARERLKEGAP